MTLITDEYRDLNRQLHSERTDYGSSAGRWAAAVAHWIPVFGVSSILDYGCGKGALATQMAADNADVLPMGYDPALPPFDIKPQAADMVVCTDVLEHVEPECLDDVLRHIWGLTNGVAFINVACRPAVKTLPDGRNAHLIQKPAAWWFEKLSVWFDLDTTVTTGADTLAIAIPRNEEDVP